MASIWDTLKNAADAYKKAMENAYKPATSVKPTDTYKTNTGRTKQYGNLQQNKTPTQLQIDKDVVSAVVGRQKAPASPVYSGSSGVSSGSNTGGSFGGYYSAAVPDTSAYDAYRAAIDEQNRLLREQQELARQQREARMNATIVANNQAADKSLKDAYVATMLAKRNLPQQLKAMGISGGATETTLSDIDNTYMNNRFGIEENRNDANRQARLAYEQGVNGDYASYLAKAYELQGSLADRYKTKASESGTKGKTTGMAQDISGVKSSAVTDTVTSSNEDVARLLTQQYIKEGWSKSQIERMLRQQGLLE